MNLYKRLLSGLILMLVAAAVLISPGCVSERAEDPPAELSEYLQQGKADELSLIIYFLNPYYLTYGPVSEKELIEKFYEYRITVNGIVLWEYTDLLDRVANAALTPVEQESYVNARIYYVFETEDKDKIFSVCMWSGKGGIYVNGLEVKADGAFYDVLMPFLPGEAAEEFNRFLETYKGYRP